MRPIRLVGTYRTKDDRYVQLMMLQLDKFYPEAMRAIGLPELIDDPRFAEPASRFENRIELDRVDGRRVCPTHPRRMA